MSIDTDSVLKEGSNCRRKLRAQRIGWLVDADEYFMALRDSFGKPQNEWRPASYTVRALKKRFGVVPRRGAWPSRRPLLPLDSICVSPETVRRTVHVAGSTRARHASDHLPLYCEFELPGPEHLSADCRASRLVHRL